MAYILVIVFYATVQVNGTDHRQIDHIDSIRFDSSEACNASKGWLENMAVGTDVLLQCEKAAK
jgi:hypothetical protein